MTQFFGDVGIVYLHVLLACHFGSLEVKIGGIEARKLGSLPRKHAVDDQLDQVKGRRRCVNVAGEGVAPLHDRVSCPVRVGL